MAFIWTIWRENEKKEGNCLVGNLLFRIYALSKIKKLIALFNMNKQSFSTIRKLISKDNIKETFKQLNRIEGLDKSKRDLRILLENQYSSFVKNKMGGLYRNGEDITENALLVNNILAFINSLEEQKDILFVEVSKEDLLKIFNKGKLNEVFIELNHLELGNRTNLADGVLDKFISIQTSFFNLERSEDINDLSAKERADITRRIKTELHTLIVNLEATIFDKQIIEVDENIVTEPVHNDKPMPKEANNFKKIASDLQFFVRRFTNRDSLYNDINKALFMGDKYAFFDDLVFDFINTQSSLFAGIDDKLGEKWSQKFIDNPRSFLRRIKKAVSKNSVNCTIFNSLNRFITDNKTITGLEVEQKAFGLLLLVSQCVSFVEHHKFGDNNVFRHEFIKMSNRIIGRIFKDKEFTIVEFKQILSANKLSDISIARLRKPKLFKELKKLVDEKLGALKDIVKAIFKILDADFTNKNSKPQLQAEDLRCLFHHKKDRTLFIPKRRFTLIRRREIKLERDFLFSFHHFFMKVHSSASDPEKDYEFNYDFLVNTTLDDQFKYRKMSIFMGLTQFWLLPTDNKFLGQWLK
jgi:hypothetical protein